MFSGKRFGSDRKKHKFQPKRFASTQSVSDFPPLLLAADAAFQISNNPQTTTKKHKHKPLQKPGHTALRLISLQCSISSLLIHLHQPLWLCPFSTDGPSYRPILVEGNGHSVLFNVILLWSYGWGLRWLIQRMLSQIIWCSPCDVEASVCFQCLQYEHPLGGFMQESGIRQNRYFASWGKVWVLRRRMLLATAIL